MNRAKVTSDTILSVHDDAAKSAPLIQGIAYVSLCMIAAAYGGMIGPAWCQWWAIFGLLGLASAAGLDALERSRTRLANHRRARQLAMNAERKLDEMMSKLESSNAVCAALREFQPDGSDPKLQGANCEADSRLSLRRPAKVTRLRRSGSGAEERQGEPLPARVRDISRHGFGITHDHRLERGPILLQFTLDNGELLEFVGDVLWCELQDSGCYFSGGKLLKLVSPSDARPARCLSQVGAP